MSDVKIVAARNEQSKKSKKATLDLLKGKKPRSKTISIEISGEQVEMTFQAISSHELDALQAKHTPTTEQRVKGSSFNPQTFPPALVAACSVEPQLTEEDTKEIWESDAWSMGELAYLFDTVSELCTQGLNVPFTESD